MRRIAETAGTSEEKYPASPRPARTVEATAWVATTALLTVKLKVAVAVVLLASVTVTV